MNASISKFLRAATGTAFLAVLTACSTLTATLEKCGELAARTSAGLASGEAIEKPEAAREPHTAAAGQWLADAREGLADALRIAGGGAGGAVMGALGGAGAGFLTVAKAGGCPDPATCNSLVAGMMTAGAVIGGVIGFVEGVRKARLELAVRTRPQPSPAKPTNQPIFRTEPSPATTGE